jgi:anti-sigma B factor antagonist
MTVTAAPLGVALTDDASWVLSGEGDPTVITVQGELDFAAAGPFAAALASVGADGSDVIVDMAGVEFIDGTALGALLRVQRLFEILGLTLTVRAPARAVRRVLTMCQVDLLIQTA